MRLMLHLMASWVVVNDLKPAKPGPLYWVILMQIKLKIVRIFLTFQNYTVINYCH